MSQKRSIFEDVDTDQKAEIAKPQTGMIDRARGGRGWINGWLVALFVLVLAIIVVGGLTRLTHLIRFLSIAMLARIGLGYL